MSMVRWGLTTLYTEPAVMLATLNVHESMGQKVDREAVATLVLPQLWTMSMGPRQFPTIYSKASTYPLRSTKCRSVYTLHEVCLFPYLSAVTNDVMTYLQRDQNPWRAGRA